MDDATVATLRMILIEAIQRWEPRVVIDHARTVVLADEDAHIYDARIVFMVKGLGDTSFTVRSLYKQKTV